MAGQLRGFAKIVRDETERIVQEKELRASHEDLERRVRERTEALRKSEDRFSKAFNANPTPTTLVRVEDNRVLDVNDSFCC